MLACRCRGRCRCSLISSSRHLVVRCRPVFSACLRLISSVAVSPVVSFPVSPRFDTIGRGDERGASVSCLLGFCPAVCVGVDSRLMVFPLRCPIPWSACLSARLRGRWRSHLVRAGRVAMPCLPRRIVSSLASAVVSSVGSVLRLSPRLAARWAGRRADAARCYSFLTACLIPLCLLAP